MPMRLCRPSPGDYRIVISCAGRRPRVLLSRKTPLRDAAGSVAGILGISAAITEAEVRLLTAVADMAAAALHRATLHEQTQQRARRRPPCT